MTGESKKVSPSSVISTGTLPSGLSSGIRVLASQGESTTSSKGSAFSARMTRILRA
jgi:hypothetical protein